MAAVAARYARALADVVTGPKAPATADEVESQLRTFLAVMDEGKDLRIILASPAVKAVKKKSIIDALGARVGLSPIAKNFLFVLLDNRRIPLLAEILPAFRAMIDARSGLVEAHVSSPAPMAEADRGMLEAALGRRTGKRVRATYTVDPALIGGAVTRIGSTIYDGSVREHLRVLRARLSSQ
jgi:F-type H+-transporting ATPase subunit delta